MSNTLVDDDGNVYTFTTTSGTTLTVDPSSSSSSTSLTVSGDTTGSWTSGVTTTAPIWYTNGHGSHNHGSYHIPSTSASFTFDDAYMNVWGPAAKTKGGKRPRFNQYFKCFDKYFVGSELDNDQVLLFDEVNGEVSIQNINMVSKIKKWEYDLQMIYQL